jgi:dUTP pyrophosphatase
MVVNGVGTVDYNYRGEVGTILYNSGKEAFTVNRGDRVSQAVICPIYKPEIVMVDKVDETDRGTNGYGSSGVK